MTITSTARRRRRQPAPSIAEFHPISYGKTHGILHEAGVQFRTCGGNCRVVEDEKDEQ